MHFLAAVASTTRISKTQFLACLGILTACGAYGTFLDRKHGGQWRVLAAFLMVIFGYGFYLVVTGKSVPPGVG